MTENRRVVSTGGKAASGRPELMGITKASLATESWLSAAVYAAYDEYDFTPFESQGSGEAVRLDEFEVPR